MYAIVLYLEGRRGAFRTDSNTVTEELRRTTAALHVQYNIIIPQTFTQMKIYNKTTISLLSLVSLCENVETNVTQTVLHFQWLC